MHGGAGGVGTAAIQLGARVGARVTATVRNPDSREQVAALGATVIEPDGFEQHGPFDVILELVGAPNLGANVDALATTGRIVVIGIGAGAKAELNLAKLMYKRGAHHGLDDARPAAGGEGADDARRSSATCCRSSSGARSACRSPRRSALDEAPAAYERFAAGGKLGKLVLLP